MQQESDRQQEPNEERPDIHVDEDWKKAVADEKQRLREQEQAAGSDEAAPEAGPTQYPEPTIPVFLAGLYTQTLVALGVLENPLSGERTKNVAEAAYLIDTIGMLKEKTDGNLTEEEDAYFEHVLYDLRLRYVSAAGEPPQAQPEPAGEGED
jgi:hypothetical protein